MWAPAAASDTATSRRHSSLQTEAAASPPPPPQPTPLINPTHKGLRDRGPQKKSDTFVAKIGKAVHFFGGGSTSPPPEIYANGGITANPQEGVSSWQRLRN